MNDATVERIVRQMARDACVKKTKPVATHTEAHIRMPGHSKRSANNSSADGAGALIAAHNRNIPQAIQFQRQMQRDFNAHPLHLQRSRLHLPERNTDCHSMGMTRSLKGILLPLTAGQPMGRRE